MKKIIVLVFLLTLFVGINFSVDASTKSEQKENTYNTIEYYKTYYKDGKTVHEKQLTENDYFKEVRSEKEKAAKKIEIQNKLYSNLPVTEEEKDILLPSIYTLYLTEDFGPYHNPIGEEQCYDNASACTIYAVYDEIGLSIFQTTVVIFPNNTVQEDGRTGYITTTLTWDILPYDRKDDLISVSWDSDDFSGNFSSINTHVRNEYTHYVPVIFWGILINTLEYECTSNTDHNLVNSGENYSVTDDGVVFQVPLLGDLLPLQSRESADFYGIELDFYDYLIVHQIVITLSADFKLDNMQSIDADFITNAQFVADYVHFYDKLSFKIGLSAGISISGPSAGITISPVVTETIDKHRLTFIDFTFTSYIPSC